MARVKYKCQRCKEYVVRDTDGGRPPIRSGATRDYSDAREGCTMWECDDEFCPFPRATAPASAPAAVESD